MNKWAGRRRGARTALTELLLGNAKRIKLPVFSLKIFNNNKDNDYNK